jgi:Domain of unknown function (DUF4389)
MQGPPSAPELPVRLRVESALQRNRLTVFFRLVLAIPHVIWLTLWGLGAVVLAIVNWFAVLFTGRTPDGIHRFLTAYVNYAAQLYAYLTVAANRYPGFVGDPGYELDIEFDPPARQNRWIVAFRLVLALPALLLVIVIAGIGFGGDFSTASDSAESAGSQVVGVLGTAAVLTWFYSLFRGRAPEGVVRLSWFAIHYGAQVYAYLFVLTDRYPRSDPTLAGVPRTPPPHPIALREEHDTLARSRLTVFFRLPLAVPHLVWLTLWALLVVLVAIVNWFATLIRGQSPAALQRFLAAFQRYAVHVQAFVTLVANPFPGFTGRAGSFPVDVAIEPPDRQRRWGVAFRIVLALPALLLQSALNGALYVAAILGWFAALFTGRMPRSLRNLGAFAIRYGAQASSYGFLLLTIRYPYAGPPAGPLQTDGAAAADLQPTS